MLTRKQYDLLMFIHRRMQRDGVSPSFDEMKDALDLRSKSGIHRLITALEERGFIRRLAHRARAVEILRLPENMEGSQAARGFRPAVIEGDRAPGDAGRDAGGDARFARSMDRLGATPVDSQHTGTVPLVGRIAAGVPIEAIQQRGSEIGVPSMMLSSSGEHFALEVRGDSMVDAGILEGDIVVLHRQDSAETGDIVVALIEDQEATLKRLRRKGGGAIALEAANPAYGTHVYRTDQVRIQGRMVGLIRTY